jgi:hypothetical protein
MLKLCDYVVKTSGIKALIEFYEGDFGKIHYVDGLGYISIINADRNEVRVFGYGKTIEEAFIPILIEHEFVICEDYELNHRQKLNKQFSKRFLNGVYSKDDYHGPFFFDELALQHFRKYYGDNIPEEIIQHYENHLKEVYACDYKYDYATNSLVLVDEKEKQFRK